MNFTIPQAANPFGGTASVSVDPQDVVAVGSLQWKIKAQVPFANLNKGPKPEMFFTIPLTADPFGGPASVSAIRQVNPLDNTVSVSTNPQDKVGAIDTGSTADTTIDTLLVATGADL